MFIGTKREETKEEGERWLFPDPEGKDWHAGLQRTIVGVRRNRDIRANEWCILRQIQAHYPLQFRWEEAEDPFGTEDPPNSILTAAFCRMDAEEAGSEGGLERREGGPEVRACSRIEAVLTCNRKGGGSRNTQWGVALALEGSNAVRGKARLSAPAVGGGEALGSHRVGPQAAGGSAGGVRTAGGPGTGGSADEGDLQANRGLRRSEQEERRWHVNRARSAGWTAASARGSGCGTSGRPPAASRRPRRAADRG